MTTALGRNTKPCCLNVIYNTKPTNLCLGSRIRRCVQYSFYVWSTLITVFRACDGLLGFCLYGKEGIFLYTTARAKTLQNWKLIVLCKIKFKQESEWIRWKRKKLIKSKILTATLLAKDTFRLASINGAPSECFSKKSASSSFILFSSSSSSFLEDCGALMNNLVPWTRMALFDSPWSLSR